MAIHDESQAFTINELEEVALSRLVEERLHKIGFKELLNENFEFYIYGAQCASYAIISK